MKIREAVSSDFAMMNRIYEQVDEEHRIAHPDIFVKSDQVARTTDFLNSIVQDYRQRLIVAVEEDKVIGLAKADIRISPDIPLYKDRKWLSIVTIVVDKDYRGNGIGKHLLNDLFEWARMNNVDEVELTVFAFNESAIRFYEKNGFSNISYRMRNRI